MVRTESVTAVGGVTPTGTETTIVLESVAAPGSTTKFIDQVVRHAPTDVRFEFFSWRTALLGRYDVFHVHWPEFLVRGRNAPIRWMRRQLGAMLLRRLRRLGIPVVRTLHNLEPHERGSSSERRFLDGLDDLTTVWVVLNEATPSDRGRGMLIRHGHYIDQFAEMKRSEPSAGRLLFFGRIEAYKGVTELVRAFSTVPDQALTLRLVGSAGLPLRDELRALAEADPRIGARFEFVSDEEMVSEITAAELVVLPYREMHNSGVLLVALSLGRPVLVPASRSNDLIAQEVGEEWVLQYEGELDRGAIELALLRVRSSVSPAPQLGGRDWRTVGARYADAFRAAAADDRRNVS
jgi:beta-1,4-mannosyltransferase